ncbi:MAG: hypothetical protein ACLPYS_10505 [Vulcanimicrobiaceae bacterium]
MSDAPELDDVRQRIELHRTFAHRVPGELCDTCFFLYAREEALMEVYLSRFQRRRTAAGVLLLAPRMRSR